ncbi:MAG: gas vesicle protein [Bacteroidales bacterium]|nr:gas vesicle protein [Bacteroidales bacterium]
MHDSIIDRSKEITILELLDRVLTKGVIITGDVVISVAGIDLIYLGVKLMLSSVETMEQLKAGKPILKKIAYQNTYEVQP